MRHTTFLLFLSATLSACACQAQERTFDFHPIVLAAKNSSLYTARVDWQMVNERFTELTVGKEGEDLKDGLQFLINSLGDKHASFRSASKNMAIVVYYTGPSDPDPRREGTFINEVINDISAVFSYVKLEDEVGYLKVVGIGPGDVKAQADAIRAGLVDLNARGVDKWILDLRYNGGGNVNPMLAGLAPLLGDGRIGGTVGADGESYRNYSIKDGQFYNGDASFVEMNENNDISPDEKVAVLLSQYTVSSGELTAVAFKGRANTRFFGMDSGGYTTGNGYQQVTEDLFMIISEDIFADRNGVVYETRVGVDEEMEFIHSDDLTEDAQILRAVEWLRGVE